MTSVTSTDNMLQLGSSKYKDILSESIGTAASFLITELKSVYLLGKVIIIS